MDIPAIWRNWLRPAAQAASSFQRPRAPGRRTRKAARAGGCELITLIGSDLTLDCGIVSDGPVIVAGAVSGGIESPWVEICRKASIGGSLKADNAIIDGEVSGSVYGRNISLGSSARVSGEIVCERLHAAQGAVVGGRTHPSLRLNRALLRDLARIARNARAAEDIDQAALESLVRDGLIFERGGAVFVSIFGFLELNRSWARAVGIPRSRTGELRLAARRPPQVRACREQAAGHSAPLSVIADDVRLDSDLATAGDIRIHGDVRGEVSARNCLTGDASRIAGSITAQRATLAGYVCGAVSAESLLLLRTARIEGPVNFGAIETRGGAHYTEGKQTVRPAAASTASRIGAHLRQMPAAA